MGLANIECKAIEDSDSNLYRTLYRLK